MQQLTVDCFSLEMADILAHRVGKSSLARVLASPRDQRAWLPATIRHKNMWPQSRISQ
jgi:hypothetical protein